MTESKKIGASDSRQKKWKGKVIKQGKGGNEANFSGNKHKRRRLAGNKIKNMNCFNCGKLGYFAHYCTESKTQKQPTTKRGTETPSWIFVKFQKKVGPSTWEIILQWMCLELAPTNW